MGNEVPREKANKVGVESSQEMNFSYNNRSYFIVVFFLLEVCNETMEDAVIGNVALSILVPIRTVDSVRAR